MVNEKEIRKRMIDCEKDVYALARLLGKSYSTVQKKLNNKTPMTLEEADKIQSALGIHDEDFGFYFMSHERQI